VRAVLDALAALHDRRIAHGNLKLENIIVTRRPEGDLVLLVDGGVDRLRLRARAMNGHSQFVHTLASPKTVAPEQIRGSIATPRADVYAFGAVLYEVLTGKPVFTASQAVDLAVSHLIEEPSAPSETAPRGWVPKNVDDFVLSLLAKEPTGRPRDARALLETFEGLSKSPATGAVDAMNEEELEARIQELLTSPDNEGLPSSRARCRGCGPGSRRSGLRTGGRANAGDGARRGLAERRQAEPALSRGAHVRGGER
jgi:serine/threonine protein kinase